MEGPPPAAQYLLTLARSLAVQSNYRVAALTYAAAAKAPGTSGSFKANSLYRAASYLYRPEQPPPEDLTRAIQYLQKCSILLKSQPDSFDMRMKALSLLDKIYTSFDDASAAGKTIKVALDIATSDRQADTAKILHWWVYFRCRAVSNAISAGNLQRALLLASESASGCVRYGDSFSAIAFQLCVCQLALSLPSSSKFDVWQVLRIAEASANALQSSSRDDDADIYLLRFGVYLLQGLAHMRVGSLPEARNNIAEKLRQYYNGLRQVQKSGCKDGMWRWLPPLVATSLTFHVMAAVYRGTNQASDTWMYASTALAKLGIKQETLHHIGEQHLFIAGISPRSYRALAVAALDSATRYRLTVIDLLGAQPLTSAAVTVAFADEAAKQELVNLEAGRKVNIRTIIPVDMSESEVVLRCSVLLLCAEYHFLRGRVSAARTATKFVQIVRETMPRYRDCFGHELVTDSWQMAQSYLSLLTGEPRSDGIISEISASAEGASSSTQRIDTRFSNKHVLAMSWFAIGVYHMRANDVLEARKGFKCALAILKCPTSVNEQIVANAMVSLSGLVLTHANIDENATEMLNAAMAISRQMNDSVTLVRASRQNKKLAVRLNLPQEQRAAAEAVLVQFAEELTKKHEAAVQNIIPETL